MLVSGRLLFVMILVAQLWSSKAQQGNDTMTMPMIIDNIPANRSWYICSKANVENYNATITLLDGVQPFMSSMSGNGTLTMAPTSVQPNALTVISGDQNEVLKSLNNTPTSLKQCPITNSSTNCTNTETIPPSICCLAIVNSFNQTMSFHLEMMWTSASTVTSPPPMTMPSVSPTSTSSSTPASSSTSAPDSSTPASSSNTGLVVGLAVTSTVIVMSLAVGIGFCIYRHRSFPSAQPNNNQILPPFNAMNIGTSDNGPLMASLLSSKVAQVADA